MENLPVEDFDEEQIEVILAKAKRQGYLSGFDFAIAIQDLFITYPIINDGNWENVNAALLIHLVEACKKNPKALKKLQY